MSSPVYTIKIAGPAGAGIKSTGLLLSNLLLKHGLNIRDYSEYPSLIRGGHNTYQVSFSTEDVYASHFHVDVFFSLHPDHWQQHQPEFDTNSLIFVDNDSNLKLPLEQLSTTVGGKIYANTICLGVATFIFGLDLALSTQIISDHYGVDSPNVLAFKSGYDYAASNFSDKKINITLAIGTKDNHKIYDGNEAYGWGFVQGKGNFYASYPMTPSSTALHFLASKQTEYQIKVIHTEDEIAAASMASGASFAGARAAVGTSGGGFALMVETVSFNGAANLGVVYYLAQRPGPATGLPTWTSQGDLLFAINAGHGEFNKIVLSAADQQDSFDLSVTALNLASRFNVPVILLSDKFISESAASLPDLTSLPVDIINSTKPVPGTAGQEYLANSYEHDDQGFSTEDGEVVKKNALARIELTNEIIPLLPAPFFLSPPSAKKLIISWGSTKSTILEALKLIDNPNDFALLHLRSLWPIAPELENLIKPFSETILIENNAFGQLKTLLKSQFNFEPTKTLLKFDGRPFFPEELANLLK